MKFILAICLLLVSLYAENNYLNIDAKSFEANEKENFIHFNGDVKMTKNSDYLKCQDLMIYTKKTKKNKQLPIKYEATKDVSFEIVLKKSILKGRGDKLVYYPLEKRYIIIGNAYLEDTKTDKKLSASKIYIDEKTGFTKIDGQKDKPVKFRLKLGN